MKNLALVCILFCFSSIAFGSEIYTCEATMSNKSKCTATCPKGLKVLSGGCTVAAHDGDRYHWNTVSEGLTDKAYLSSFGPVFRDGVEGYSCEAVSGLHEVKSGSYKAKITVTATALCTE